MYGHHPWKPLVLRHCVVATCSFFEHTNHAFNLRNVFTTRYDVDSLIYAFTIAHGFELDAHMYGCDIEASYGVRPEDGFQGSFHYRYVHAVKCVHCGIMDVLEQQY